MTVVASSRFHKVVLGVSGAATAVIAWPLFVKSEIVILAIAATALVWAWIASFFYLAETAWPYHRLWGVIAVLLSILAPGVSFWVSGAKTDDILVSVVIVGTLSLACVTYIWKRR